MGKRAQIRLGDYKSIVFLTGAGLSKASGIQTYRGPGGLWNDEALVKLVEYETFQRDPLQVWRFMSETRRICAAARPNPARAAERPYGRTLSSSVRIFPQSAVQRQ